MYAACLAYLRHWVRSPTWKNKSYWKLLTLTLNIQDKSLIQNFQVSFWQMESIKGLHLRTLYIKPFKGIPLAQKSWKSQEDRLHLLQGETVRGCDDNVLSISSTVLRRSPTATTSTVSSVFTSKGELNNWKAKHPSPAPMLDGVY